ncbi:MAG: RDD family protein, partial [Candidatus Nanohaloarchaea archaeon]|nr:RDD family protein [Candidatus Nanohaloarchaea archaeon]
MDAEPASLVSRSLVVVDHLIASFIGLLVGGLPAVLFTEYLPLDGLLLIAAAVGLANVGYFIYFEGRDGTTPVKQRFGLQVVTRDGSPIGYQQAAVRNIVRLGELATAYLVGIGLATATAYSQRPGDIAASTVVIEPEDQADSYRLKAREVSEQDRIVGYLVAGIGVLPLIGMLLQLAT